MDQISLTCHIALLRRVSKINRVREKDSDWQGTIRLAPIVSQLTRAIRGTYTSCLSRLLNDKPAFYSSQLITGDTGAKGIPVLRIKQQSIIRLELAARSHRATINTNTRLDPPRGILHPLPA